MRPLIHEDGKNPSEISRKDEVWESKSGLVTIAGGKLTGYRKMAETVLNTIAKELKAEFGIDSKPCSTKHIHISGGDIGGSQNLEAFVARRTEKGMELGLSAAEANHLAHHYGANVDMVFSYAQKRHETIPQGLYAQLLYGIHHEMVVHPNDFLIRRTANMFFNIADVKAHKDAILDAMASLLNWSVEQRERFTADLTKEITRATTAL